MFAPLLENEHTICPCFPILLPASRNSELKKWVNPEELGGGEEKTKIPFAVCCPPP
uniref:Uncharacterized protein n=1 Tax=Arundo donax TaxID=35708 RepID=A0A0A9ASI3_ARUDO